MLIRGFLGLCAIMVCTWQTSAAQMIPDRFEIGEFGYAGESYPWGWADYVSENERTIIRDLGLTVLHFTMDETAFMRYLDSVPGGARQDVQSLPPFTSGVTYKTCVPWVDPIICMADYGADYPDSLWRHWADHGVDLMTDYFRDHPSLYGYHCGEETPECCDTATWPGIGYLAHRIRERALPSRPHIVMDFPFNWLLDEGLFDTVPDLDVVWNFQYPMSSPFADPSYAGANYQRDFWDDMLDRSYDVAGRSLRDRDVVWYAGYTASSQGIPSYSRHLTPAEINCQLFLGACRGAKGVVHFTLADILPISESRKKRWRSVASMPGGGFFPYDAVRDVYRRLTKLGPHLLPLYFDEGYTSNDVVIPPAFVDTLTGEYIEVGCFTDLIDGSLSFILVNRVCNNTDGTPASPQLVSARLDLGSSTPDSVLRIVDVLNDDTLIARLANGRYYMYTVLRPGDGRLYEVIAKQSGSGLADTDSDGIEDGIDNCWNVANPDQADSDGDGMGDLCDPCPTDLWNDRDGDGLCGDADPCPGDSLNDGDGDGICAELDNCPEVFNPDQHDWDGDKFGDACDNCLGSYVSQSDRDGDGLGDCCDNCPDMPNVDQQDSDDDRVGNACDNCAWTYNRTQPDRDGDLVGDECDDCPDNPNHDQLDTDQDSFADACDNCPSINNALQADFDQDSLGDACDYLIMASVPDTTGQCGTSFVWPIYLSNDVPLREIEVTVSISSVPLYARLDSINTVGCRTEYFEKTLLTNDDRGNGKLAFLMKANNGGPAQPLPPGSGPVAKIFMRLLTGIPNGTQITFTAPVLGTHAYTVKGLDATLPNSFGDGTLMIETSCACDCHADPACDGVRSDILDVVATINVAFRGSASILDPNAACPNETTDANCSGATDVLDVVNTVNVAFRGANAATEFCNPCP